MSYRETLMLLVLAYNDDVLLGEAMLNAYRVRFPRAKSTGVKYDRATRFLAPWKVSQRAVMEWRARGKSAGAFQWAWRATR
jgi:hypothetical protein